MDKNTLDTAANEHSRLTLDKKQILNLDSQQLSLQQMQEINGGIVETDQVPNCKGQAEFN